MVFTFEYIARCGVINPENYSPFKIWKLTQYNNIWKRMELRMEIIAQLAPIPVSLAIGIIGIIGELPLCETRSS